jgi:hypothetical protein
MKQLRLVRVSEHLGATLGVLVIDGQPTFTTLEDKWLENEKSRSCIPLGKYTLRRHQSPKFGDCFQVLDVEGRDAILIHSGNTHHDTHGCILIGMAFGTLGPETAILSSKVAFTTFMGMMLKDYELSLEITKGY